MITSYLLTLSQLKDQKIFKPLCYATLLTISSIVLLLVLGAGGISWALDLLNHTLHDWFGDAKGLFRGVIQLIGASFILVIGYFTFAGIHAAFLGVFIDDIFDAIQVRHYPDFTLHPPPTLAAGVIFSMRFILFTLLINFLALPFYLLGWIFPPVGISIQIGINGYLLGKEYGTLCRMRVRNDPSKKTAHFAEGLLASCIWMIPVINLTAPVLLAGSVLHSQIKASK
ncbi:MAG: EI24 domain-containing protein [Opitutales bacterium]|nr:EI24 domain-containing protein [Opitutales bacterium]